MSRTLPFFLRYVSKMSAPNVAIPSPFDAKFSIILVWVLFMALISYEWSSTRLLPNTRQLFYLFLLPRWHKFTIVSHSEPVQPNPDIYTILYTGCFKTSFTTLKAHINLFRRHAQCFELSYCSKIHWVSHSIVGLNMTSTGNARRFKKSFTMVFQMLLCGECYKNVYI
jgi:hypothetical protein